MSKSRKLAIAGLVLNPVGFIVMLAGIIASATALFAVAASGADESVAGATVVAAGAGALASIAIGSVMSLAAFIVSIIAAVKTTNRTAMILTLVGLFVLPILAWVGLGMIIKEDMDK
ncbi:Uncharacterised protein [Metamycoplasma cloacale]|uniref:Uncharacterized protein n=1 Tax=Metamycoplasma cloacale TaxID=92401 RepID=A0A2Z4LMA5_9BACT|nr:hypothetical protein [Metamycoplasma cloacale]AWX42879.1 hypothetical protein DK849_02295 [Metamycoplasma cloacale]VEU79297.1 Uncharacterised protein [Metamycoplasma cloacale]